MRGLATDVIARPLKIKYSSNISLLKFHVFTKSNNNLPLIQLRDATEQLVRVFQLTIRLRRNSFDHKVTKFRLQMQLLVIMEVVELRNLVVCVIE